MYQKQLGGPSFFHVIIPLPAAVTPPEATLPTPLYLSAKEAADSGLTCNNDNRKRSRENYFMPDDDSTAVSQMPRLSSLLEREAAIQIHHQQREFDYLIALHTHRLKVELEERAKVLVSTVRGAVESKMREKDEEIKRLSKLNWALQERVRSLCVENHLLRGLAQSNQAAANSRLCLFWDKNVQVKASKHKTTNFYVSRKNIYTHKSLQTSPKPLPLTRSCTHLPLSKHSVRTNLERVLTSPGIVEDSKPDKDGAESCCGSNEEGEGVGGCWGFGGRREAGVLDMPCRHLCLCTTCGSSRKLCPVCGSAITAYLHVNFSSSS